MTDGATGLMTQGRSYGIEARGGTYALILRGFGERPVRIGRLGTIRMQDGYYVYVGSAHGPGGVMARVQRHTGHQVKLFWHIDYLKHDAEACEIWYTYDRKHREHQWARALTLLDGASVPLRGFGASDCSCSSHLVYFSEVPDVAAFRERICHRYKRHGPILRVPNVDYG